MNDIVLSVDYHDENCQVRQLNLATGEEVCFKCPTTRGDLLRIVQDAERQLQPGGQVVWIMESTTGWARVKDLLGSKVRFILANVLQMPLPPKARRRKTDKIDTARNQREYLNGSLPRAFQPPAELRRLRRVVALREKQVSRQTSARNWIDRYFAHETWEDRKGLWSQKGLRRLKGLAALSPDRFVLEARLRELEYWEKEEGSSGSCVGGQGCWGSAPDPGVYRMGAAGRKAGASPIGDARLPSAPMSRSGRTPA